MLKKTKERLENLEAKIDVVIEDNDRLKGDYIKCRRNYYGMIRKWRNYLDELAESE